MATVWLGNPHAIDPGTKQPAGDTITVIGRCFREWHTLDELVRTIVHPDGHWSQHSNGTPSWVASDDPELAARLAGHWGCPVGDPTAAAAAHAAARGIAPAPETAPTTGQEG